MPTPQYVLLVPRRSRIVNSDHSITLGNRVARLTGRREIHPTIFELHALDDFLSSIRLPQHFDGLGSVSGYGCIISQVQGIELIGLSRFRHHVTIGKLLAFVERILAQVGSNDHAQVGRIIALDGSRNRIFIVACDIEIVRLIRTGENPERDIGGRVRAVVVRADDLDESTMSRSLAFALVCRKRNLRNGTTQILRHIPTISLVQDRAGLLSVIEEVCGGNGGDRTGNRSLIRSRGRNRTQLNRLQRERMTRRHFLLASERNLGYHTLQLDFRLVTC